MSLRPFIAAFALLVLPADAAIPFSTQVGRSTLSEFPNTTIDYYDVEGATVTAINQSIRAQRGTGSGGKIVPSSTAWTVKADFKRETVNGRCTVQGATAEFAARAELPRLVGGEKLSGAERERWSDYVSLLEESSAATLTFVYQNLVQVESAINNSSCEDARGAAASAVELLRAHANRLSAENEKRLAALSQFRPAMLSNSKLTCRDLKGTGGRLRVFRTCLPAREWERMWKSSSEYTQGIVSKFSKSPRTPF